MGDAFLTTLISVKEKEVFSAYVCAARYPAAIMQTLPTAAILAVARAMALSGIDCSVNADASFGVQITGRTPNINGGGSSCAGVRTNTTSGPAISSSA